MAYLSERYNNISYEGCCYLIAAIIKCAFEDALISDEDIKKSNENLKVIKLNRRRSAIKFLNSELFEIYCELTDLDKDYLLQRFKTSYVKRKKNRYGQ